MDDRAFQFFARLYEWMIEPFGSLYDAMNYVMQTKIQLGTK